MALRPTLPAALFSALALGAVSLSGCVGLPVGVEAASYAIDGGSYTITGKGPTDHILSAVTGEDCATLRVFTTDNHQICTPKGAPIGMNEVKMNIPAGAATAPGVTSGGVAADGAPASGSWAGGPMPVMPLADMNDPTATMQAQTPASIPQPNPAAGPQAAGEVLPYAAMTSDGESGAGR